MARQSRHYSEWTTGNLPLAVLPYDLTLITASIFSGPYKWGNNSAG